MSFDSFSDFLSMGGHGLYVWLSYAIAVAVVIVNIVLPTMSRRQLFADARRRLRREDTQP